MPCVQPVAAWQASDGSGSQARVEENGVAVRTRIGSFCVETSAILTRKSILEIGADELPLAPNQAVLRDNFNMNDQFSLFDGPMHEQDQTGANSLAIQTDRQRIGPAQKQFNQLLAKIEAAKTSLIHMQSLLAQYAPARAQRIGPLEEQVLKLQGEMAIFLDQRLRQPKGLSKKVQQDIADIVLALTENLVARGGADPAFLEIYERYSQDPDDPDFGDDDEAMTDMQEMLSAIFGVEFKDSDQIDSADAMFEAAMEKARAQREAAQAAHEAKRTRRKKSARQKQQEQEALDTDKVLREIYRKLASALHPDRETDPEERIRKAALMAQVNAANDRRDLLTLLQLQLQIEQLNPGDVAAMADEKLRHFNRVLKEQEQSLRHEQQQLAMQIRDSLGLTWGTPLNERNIDAALRAEVQGLQHTLDLMQRDLAVIRQDPGLKRWVKEQSALMNNYSPEDFF